MSICLEPSTLLEWNTVVATTEAAVAVNSARDFFIAVCSLQACVGLSVNNEKKELYGMGSS